MKHNFNQVWYDLVLNQSFYVNIAFIILHKLNKLITCSASAILFVDSLSVTNAATTSIIVLFMKLFVFPWKQWETKWVSKMILILLESKALSLKNDLNSVFAGLG